MGRRSTHVKKEPWTFKEDAKLLEYVDSHGVGNWTLVSQKTGLNRCGKSCRSRWTNYLRPDLKNDSFTRQEEELILRYHQAMGNRWSLIAKNLPGRTDNDVKNHWNTKLKKKLTKMGIDPITHKPHVKKGRWTDEEDTKLLAYVASHGIGNWAFIPQKAGLNRCGKSCRLRWTNYLRPDLKDDSFTPQEEELILRYHRAIGSRWSLIAMQLPGRTDKDVKNHWNTKLKKELIKMGIHPVTHKPLGQQDGDVQHI